VQTVDGWVYTATVIDLHSRKVVGYAVADHLRTSLIIEVLAAALVTRKPPAGVIFHSDRGCQYQCPSVKRSWVRGGPVGDRRRRLDVLAS
jgi:transposase InsO family protein